MSKKYFVEQIEDEEEEPKEKTKKVAKEQKDSGIQDKDQDKQLEPKVKEPSTQSGQSKVIPKEPLEKAKALTEQIPSTPVPEEGNNEILNLLQSIDAKLTQLIEAQTPTVPSTETMKEDAIGYEGETPSGPSLGAKTDLGGGGIKVKDKDSALTPKVEEPSVQSGQSKVIPDEPLENVKKLTESLSGRKIPLGTSSDMFREKASIESIIKDYVSGNQREVV